MRAPCCLLGLILACAAAALPARAQNAPQTVMRAATPELDAGFRLLYELKFREARERFAVHQAANPQDPLGSSSEAASWLFEELHGQGVLTSEYFLNDKKLLKGISGEPNRERRAAFMAANERAMDLAKRALERDPNDVGPLFALTLSTGMAGDYAAVLDKRQLDGVKLLRDAQKLAERLLKLSPESADAWVAIGAGNYIIGCLPWHTKFLLFFGGIHGDRVAGMHQLETAANDGHYLRPYAKLLLALASLREKQPDRARALLSELTAEFPANPLFAAELAKLNHNPASASGP